MKYISLFYKLNLVARTSGFLKTQAFTEVEFGNLLYYQAAT